MLTPKVSGAILVVMAATLGALWSGSANSEQALPPTTDTRDPARAPTGGTMMLSVRIEPEAGVVVEKATVKPALRYREPRRIERMPFRWTLLDAAGKPLVSGGFDPGPVDLDPARAGEPEVMLGGDQVIPRIAWTNVKVPDIAFDRIQFYRARSGALREFGDAVARTMEVR